MNGSSYKKNTNNSNSKNNDAMVNDGLKYEIANEFGVNLGPDATARQNGTVGGEITKRLVKMAQSNLGQTK